MASLDAASLFNVKGLVAVITGGGSGIGLMMAKALATNGAAKVYIVGRRKEVLDVAAKDCKEGTIIPLVGDVTSSTSLSALASQISSEMGYINLLIANSGIGGPPTQIFNQSPPARLSELISSLQATSAEDFTQTFAVNTTAVYYTVLAFLALLDAGNAEGNMGGTKSQVIATSSIGGFNRKVPAGIAYGTSKAAVTHLMKQLATGLVPYGIRSNVLAPGLYPSELAAPIIGDRDVTVVGAFTKDHIPAERAGTEEDMAGAILFLASRAGAYCNGNVLVTDGGRLSVMPSTY
ncbi:MAG: hypothetical protein M1833_003074 [Piccolia ochrophora]|nr:MAG: hypothetical protein M1833_003074 [Piccolia ochrophora]